MTRGCIIFDLDGTLTLPNLDFDVIRSELGVEGPILEALERMDVDTRARAADVLHRHEYRAACEALLQDGAVEVVATLRRRGWPVAVLTRNSRVCAELVLGRYSITVDALRTREDGAIKPSAEPVLKLCAQLEAEPAASWMVGDFHFDILSGRQAGTRTVLMLGGRPEPPYASEADFVIHRLKELLAIPGLANDASADKT